MLLVMVDHNASMDFDRLRTQVGLPLVLAALQC